MDMKASNVKRIILEREDGTTDVITRGLFADYSECADTDTGTVNFDICGLAGRDIGMIVMSMMDLGVRIGMFGDTSKEDDDE